MQNDSQQEKYTKTLSGTYIISLIETNKNLPDNLSITFDDTSKKVSGFTGCNRFFGTYTTDSNSIKFSELASTKMYCENVMDVENNYLKTLAQVNAFSLKANEIYLKNDTAILIEASKEILSKQKFALEYSATSRGIYKKFIIDKNNISTLQKRDGTPTKKTCDEKNWNAIINQLNNIKIENISTLKAPSKKFQFDGAAIARLKITKGDETYETPPFDHGNPPKEIAKLVKEILSISENIE